jgi:hypothetical protein
VTQYYVKRTLQVAEKNICGELFSEFSYLSPQTDMLVSGQSKVPSYERLQTQHSGMNFPVTVNYFHSNVILLYNLFVTQFNSSHRHGVDNLVIFQMIPSNLVIICNVLCGRCNSCYEKKNVHTFYGRHTFFQKLPVLRCAQNEKKDFYLFFLIRKLSTRSSEILLVFQTASIYFCTSVCSRTVTNIQAI